MQVQFLTGPPMSKEKESKASQQKHCKGCVYSTRGSKKYSKYNNWCCHLGKPCKDAIGECKLKNLYDSVPWYEKKEML